jgi:ribosomal protein S12 methylthiotransferase accessory factor
VRPFQETPTLESDNLRVDVDWMLNRLRAVDIEQVVVVDLTRETFGLPVVRVVIPGLEGPYGHEQGDFVPGARARAMMPFSSITAT